ncbi:MAG: YebC/PmpR family DNA-binding transcriptional regulator [Candidatus Arsenophonus melophagi]|nr:YebC/PmpR family DNA-binding transcriptional regulator [Candidatus Arsenophonus melophagi]
MAGHSKWANTKHRKTVQDAKRCKIFTKIIRELATAARLNGSKTLSNPRLRTAIDKALSNNMTRDTINRAIARGISNDGNDDLEKIIYEGYGPGGTAIIVECLSNNRKRTVSDVRYAFNKCGGNLSTAGSVAYLFTKRGVLSYAPSINEYSLMEAALEVGAEDIKFYDNGAIDIYTAPKTFEDVQAALDASGFKKETAELIMIPLTKVNLDPDTSSKLLHLIDMLEDFDDVQEVHHNGEIVGVVSDKL